MKTLSKAIKDSQATIGNVFYGVGGYCYSYPVSNGWRISLPCNTYQQALTYRAKHVAEHALRAANLWCDGMDYTLDISTGRVETLCRIALDRDNPSREIS